MTDQRVTKHGNFFTMHLLSIENREERAGGTGKIGRAKAFRKTY